MMNTYFNYTLADYLDDPELVPCEPGQIYDLEHSEPNSYVPEGSSIPAGVVVVRGVSSVEDGGRYYTTVDSASLPDANGAYLIAPDGQTYADAGLSLPVDVDGNLIVLGITVYSEAYAPHPTAGRLEQPYGLGERYYVEEKCGQVAVATEGKYWVHSETDMNVGDKIYFRAIVTSTVDGVQRLGGLRNDDDGGNAILLPGASVFRPGKAGGAFVIRIKV